jgi:Uma2 family endonuclease
MSVLQAPQAEQHTYTAEDLWELSHLPENSEKRLELVEGVLIEMPPAGALQGGCTSDLGIEVGIHVKHNQLGYVTAPETGYILFKNPDGKDTVRAPDVGFVSKERLPEGLPDGYVPCAPDLAIEVVSPNDKAIEIQNKINDHLKYGTRLVWVVYPKLKTAMAYTPHSVQLIPTDGSWTAATCCPASSSL